MYDLVVLGGGAGGISAATAAAKLGAKVALIEKKSLGAENLGSASVPSKTLIHSAWVARQVKMADRFGIRAADPLVDFTAVMARVRAVVQEVATSASAESLRAKGIDVYHGSPKFEAYDTITVDGHTRIEGERFVIATGSRPSVPDVPGLAQSGFLDHHSIWNLSELPETLVILGGGIVAVEFAQAFARLGSKVKLLAESDHILPREDPEIADRVEAILSSEGITIKTGIDLTRVSAKSGLQSVSFRDRTTRDTFEAAGTHILVAAGRLANVEDLGLEGVGVHADPEHGIEVDAYLQTHAQRIFAIGEVIHKFESAHAAEREAAIAVQNAVLRLSRKVDYAAMPWTTFTDPEVATVGLSEEAARLENPEILVFRAEYSDLDRARIDGRTEGFAKLVASPSGKILGLSILGEGASLIVQEFVLAKENGLGLGSIAGAVHTYPTYAGLARELANQFMTSRAHEGMVHAALRWFRGFKPRGEKAEPATTPGAAPSGHENLHGH
jgi:pyruvate/2-oxoglutarate dehydrogenase complex dihydrolipoamide dehydrogenase (E3) component